MMTSYGIQAEPLFDDEGRPFHRIICRSKWTACPGSHATPDQVKICFEFEKQMKAEGAFPCTWSVEVLTEDGPAVVECGWPATMDPRTCPGAYGCVKGHDFIPEQYLAEHGMAYASDALEAEALARHGVLPLDPGPQSRVYAL
jgi:hypothetical protein